VKECSQSNAHCSLKRMCRSECGARVGSECIGAVYRSECGASGASVSASVSVYLKLLSVGDAPGATLSVPRRTLQPT
jgi:hypothetical protein